MPMRIDNAPVPRPVALFDLDGTLIDSTALVLASYEHAFHRVLGLRVERAALLASFGRPLRLAFQACCGNTGSRPGWPPTSFGATWNSTAPITTR